LLLAHPGGHVGGKEILSILGGPLLYLIGTILFKHAIRGIFQLSHLVGIGLFIALIPFASRFTPLSLAAVAAAILMMVAAWEAISLGSGSRQSGET
jgi:low temperature requirement protein LtrA